MSLPQRPSRRCASRFGTSHPRKRRDEVRCRRGAARYRRGERWRKERGGLGRACVQREAGGASLEASITGGVRLRHLVVEACVARAWGGQKLRGPGAEKKTALPAPRRPSQYASFVAGGTIDVGANRIGTLSSSTHW